MTNEQMLSHLYHILGVTDKEKEINKMIKTLQLDIAKESSSKVGLGNGLKTLLKLIKQNDKKGLTELAGCLETNKKGVYIFTNKAYAIRSHSTFECPVISDSKKIANSIADKIDTAKRSNKKEVTLPSRAELDVIIRDWKARGKPDYCPRYSLGKGMPTYNAELLFDLLAIFPGQVGAINEDEGTMSSLYFQFAPLDGILLPLK